MTTTQAWLDKQSSNTRTHIKRHLSGPYATNHQEFVARLAQYDVIVSPGLYDSLGYIWTRLPTKRLFELAMHQNLEQVRVDMLLMAAEMGLFRHGVEVFGSAGPH